MEWLKKLVDKNYTARLGFKNLLLENHFTVIDLETTGLEVNSDKILSISAVRIEGGKINIGKSIDLLIANQAKSHLDAIAVHEITKAHTQQYGISEKDAIQKFLDFYNGSVLIGHHVGFDLGFLNNALNRHGIKVHNLSHLDTAKLAIRLELGPLIQKPDKPSEYSLSALCNRYQITLIKAHTASADTLATAQLFLKLAARFKQKGLTKTSDFL